MKMKATRLPAVLLAMALTATGASAQAPAAAAGPAPAAPQFSPQDEAEARVALGERFADMATTLARATHFSKIGMRQSAILMEAAAQMDPVEPRFWRTLALWRERLGDRDGAIFAWGKYRALLPEDRVAQARVIELYLGRLQSNDQKVKYIRELLAKPTLDDHVKAHIAVLAVPLLDQRSRPEALAMLAQARQYYPLPEVTLFEWQMLPQNATPVQRFAAMLNVVRASPTNTDAIAGVADMLAANGLSERALTWYANLVDVHASNETEANASSIINYLAERYRAGETTVANDQLDKILQKYPEDVQTWFLRLTTQRGDESAQMLHQAQQVFEKRLVDACERILKEPLPAGAAVAPSPKTPASTQPSSALTELLPRTVAHLKAMRDARASAPVVDALANFIWFELYFDHKADAATPAVMAMRQLLPNDNFLIQRLEGWYALLSGNEDLARRFFVARQEIDPIAALGLFRLEDSKGHTNEANAIGAKLLSEPHTGVEAAILYQATKGRGIKPAHAPPDAEALKNEVEKFPKDWLEVIHTPNRFYSIRADPVKVGHRLGEPMLAQVTVQNESKLDISIGENGLIKPTIVFDGQIRGVNAQIFGGVATDRIMGRLVLRPGESVSEVVRIDQGALSEALRARPAVLLLLNADVVTNARLDGPVVKAQAAGYAKNFNRMFTRSPAALALDASRRKLFADLANGSPESKILDLELLAAYYNQYMQPNATEAETTFAQQYLNFIDKSRSDPAPGVKLWASYTYAVLTTGPEERRALVDMLQSSSWETRLMALVASQNLPIAVLKPLATKAAADPDPLVKAYAAGLLELMQSATAQPAPIPPTTAESPRQATTAPSGTPATSPVAPPAAMPASHPSPGPATQPASSAAPRR